MKFKYIKKVDETDDSEYLRLVNNVVRKLRRQLKVDEVFVIKIKNWFDHKWLNFSGKLAIPFDTSPYSELHSALKDHWADKKTFPPFSPNRMIVATRWSKLDHDKSTLNQIHKWQPTSQNLYRRIQQYTNDALFVWYTSNTKINKQGAIMAYSIKEETVTSWYASFVYEKQWKVKKTKEIAREDVEMLGVLPC